MIRGFRHRGLRRLYENDDHRGVRADQSARIARILARLDSAVTPEDMALPALRLHPLKGDMAGHWAVSLSGNWRITWRFQGEDAFEVDLVDYH